MHTKNITYKGEKMRNITAAEKIKSLEMRIARLEREAGIFDLFSKSNEETLKKLAMKVVSALMDYGVANSYSTTTYKKDGKIETFVMVVLGSVYQGIQSKILLVVELDKNTDFLKVYIKDSIANATKTVALANVPNFSVNSDMVINNTATIIKNSLRTPKQRQRIMGLYI